MKKWLDNYGKKENANEGRSSAPKEWMGEGYSNVGRNYSPAWGGQFEDGGEIPQAQNGMPTRADSIVIMNNAIAKNNFYKNNPNYYKAKDTDNVNFKDPRVLQKLADAVLSRQDLFERKTYKNKSNNATFDNFGKSDKPNSSKPITYGDVRHRLGRVTGTRNIYSAPDIISENEIDTYFNPASPPLFFSPSILPQGAVRYESNKYGDASYSPYYDPLAVTPWDMLKPKQQQERLKKYGVTGTPYADPNYKQQITQKPKPEPFLKKKVTKMEPIPFTNQSSTPQLRTIEQPNIELPDVERGQYRTSYYDPQMKDWNERAFITQKESDQFADEMSKRGYPGAYGNVTQRVQYQLGGNVYPVNYVPQAQEGLTFLEPTSPKLPIGYANIPSNVPSSELAQSIGGEDGEPAFLIPTFKYGHPLEDANAEFRKTGEHLGGPFKTWQEADEWERTIRHPYVEKGQDIPTPLRRWGKDFAMGGSLPGSVGFTYARTHSPAPSNGPYAKKTKASAQNGEKLPYDQWMNKYNLEETPDYNLKRAWELGYVPDETGHLPTVDDQTGQFLKAKGHPTIQKELDWYNSPEGAEFRNKNSIDSSGKFFKYVPKGQNGQEMSYYQHGLDWKPKSISKNGGWLDKYIPEAQDGFITLRKDAETLDKLSQKKSFEKNITNQPQIKQGKKEISKTNNSDGRSFWETASQFIPVYEQFLDIKDIVQGAFTGDTEMRNRGIVGMAAPVSGKAVMGGLDYLTEKTQGKDAADYNEDKRKSIINSPTFNRALFEKYGWGGYDKWVADGKPPLYKEGGIIKDDRGQWDHPGEITEIGSNRITMQGVPYPVLGISDENDVQMMYPGEEYKFKGKKVTEFPMAQNGYTTDPNDYSRWQDSVNNYNESMAHLAASRKKVKKNIDDFSVLSKEGVASAIGNLFNSDVRKIRPKYSESDLPRNYYYNETSTEEQPTRVIALGDQTFYGGYVMPGTKSNMYDKLNINKDNWYNSHEFSDIYSDMVKIYPPPVRKNLQLVNPQKKVEKPKPTPPEPTLKRKPVKMETIKSKSSTSTPGIKTMSGTPVKEQPVPKRGEYRVSYYNPDIKDWSEQTFETEKESNQFADEMSKRGYGSGAGNVTQTRKVSKKENGGWLSQYK